jgi:hypothetical protein
MSRVFSNTTTNDGLVQMYELETGRTLGDVSGNTTELQKFTSATKSTWDRYLELAFRSSGKWQFDDSNHTKYPFIKANIVSGQSDYTFDTDEQGNLILDLYRVAILQSATDTEYKYIPPMDQQSGDKYSDLVTETSATGIPDRYDKTANAIFLEPTPNYSATNGLKLMINREASYFESTDTTKMPGCPGIHHDYFFLRPAMDEARRNSLANYKILQEEVIKFEGDEARRITGSIEKYFSRRSKDETVILRPQFQNYE